MPKKPPFECYHRELIPADETARMNTPEAIEERVCGLLSAWETRAERALDSSNTGDVADARAILEEIRKLKRHYLHGEPLSPQAARELFLVTTYLHARVFNLDMRPYGEKITIGESVRQGGKEAARAKHGSPEEREARYVAMRIRYEELQIDEPELAISHYAVTDRIGEEFGISGRRVRDHIINTISPRRPRK